MKKCIVILLAITAIAYGAITTKDERRSIGRVPVVPTGTIDLPARLSIGWLPITIEPGEPPEPEEVTEGTPRDRARYQGIGRY